MFLRIGFLLSGMMIALIAFAQDSTVLTPKMVDSYLTEVGEKAQLLSGRLNKHTERTLAKLKKQDAKILKRLSSIDSTKAGQFNSQLAHLNQNLQSNLAITKGINH